MVIEMRELKFEDMDVLFEKNDGNTFVDHIHFTKLYTLDDKEKAEECFKILEIAYEKVVHVLEVNNHEIPVPKPTMEEVEYPTETLIRVSGYIPFMIEGVQDREDVAKIVKNHFDGY